MKHKKRILKNHSSLPKHDFRLKVLIFGVLLVIISLLVYYYKPFSQRFADIAVGTLGGSGVMLILTELVMVKERRESRQNHEKLTKQLGKLLLENEQERAQHKKEIDEDFKKFLAQEEELKTSRQLIAELQNQLELVGAHERSRICAAIFLGYSSNEREKIVESRCLFKEMAWKLNLEVSEELIKADEIDILNMLEVNYGPVVSGAFDFGCLLALLNKDGYSAMVASGTLEHISDGLKILKCEQGIISATERFWNACIDAGEIPTESLEVPPSLFFQVLLELVTSRFFETPNDNKRTVYFRTILENPIRIPKIVRIENVTVPENGKSIKVRVCGRPIWVSNTDGKLQGLDFEDLPSDEDTRWQGWIGGMRGYNVQSEDNALIMKRTWGYSDEAPIPISLTVRPPSNEHDREPREQFIPDISPPQIGHPIIVQLGDRRVIVRKTVDNTIYGIDEIDEQKGLKFLAKHYWSISEYESGLIFIRQWNYTDEGK